MTDLDPDSSDWWRDEWPDPLTIVETMAAGESTARLNYQQRTALIIALARHAKNDRQRLVRRNLHEEVQAANADRKQARREREEMRQSRDDWRRRALAAEARQGRAGCGKVPLKSAIEAQLFIDRVCLNTGEDPAEYQTYQCRTCDPLGAADPWHIGHAVSRRARAEKDPGAPELTAPIDGLKAVRERLETTTSSAGDCASKETAEFRAVVDGDATPTDREHP